MAIRGGILVAAAAALIGGGVFATQSSGSHPAAGGPATVVNGQTVVDDNGGCDAIHQQIKNNQDFDPGAAAQCDQQEIAALAREGKTTELSETCQLINDRAEQGDPDLIDAGKLAGEAFNCRQRERAISGGTKLTALCKGTKIRLEQGDQKIDASTNTACTAELAKFKQQPDIKLTNPQQEKLVEKDDQSTDNKNGKTQTCTASFVEPGGTTSTGAPNDGDALTAQSNTFKPGDKIDVFNPITKNHVVVTVNGRVGFSCAALSKKAFDQIRTPGKNLIPNAQVTPVN
jgi:hypothetical protein